MFEAAEPERIATVNSYASPPSVIEKGCVYVHYGTYGTACLNATGILLAKDEPYLNILRPMRRVCVIHHK